MRFEAPLEQICGAQFEKQYSVLGVMLIRQVDVWLNWILVLTSMHQRTSLSVVKLLSSAAWAMPKFAASWRTTDRATSRPDEAGNFKRTLVLSTLVPDVTALLNEAHSEYIPPCSDSCQKNDYLMLSYKYLSHGLSLRVRYSWYFSS